MTLSTKTLNNSSALEHLATDLLHARDTVQLATRPSQREAGFDLSKGYQVARVLHECLEHRGYCSVGRKIGFTNPTIWKAFGLETPIWAHMYAQTVHSADRGSFRLALRSMVAPRIEPEIVLKLRAAVPAGDASAEEVAACVEWAAIGFEIVDCHYPGWRFTVADAVADFGLHAALVVGPAWRLERHEAQQTAALLRNLTIKLFRGPEVAAEGHGRNALGSPLLALGHLARVIDSQSWAPPLMAGDAVTTGTLTPLQYVARGERWRVDVAGAPLAPLELEFD